MLYGLPAGLVAGASPEPVARLLQLPTVVLVRFVAHVADAAAAWPLPHVGWPGLAVAAVGLALGLGRPGRHRR